MQNKEGASSSSTAGCGNGDSCAKSNIPTDANKKEIHPPGIVSNFSSPYTQASSSSYFTRYGGKGGVFNVRSHRK